MQKSAFCYPAFTLLTFCLPTTLASLSSLLVDIVKSTAQLDWLCLAEMRFYRSRSLARASSKPWALFPPVGLDPDVSEVIVRAEGVAPLVRRSAKGSADVRVAALSILRDVANHGHSLVESGPQRFLMCLIIRIQDLLMLRPTFPSKVAAETFCPFYSCVSNHPPDMAKKFRDLQMLLYCFWVVQGIIATSYLHQLMESKELSQEPFPLYISDNFVCLPRRCVTAYQ